MRRVQRISSPRRLAVMSDSSSSSSSGSKVFAGRFEYRKPLGKGAGGSVYLAEDRYNDRRRVALKVLSADACESVQGKMLKREFEILSKLDHPHLVQVYDYGSLPDGGIYLAEEYIDGFSLQDARGLLQPEVLIDITRQVLLGLAYLHGMRMIHRDVKPANVMLVWLREPSTRPMVKLVDFGLSSMNPSRDTLRGGTRSYMAPEIIEGNQGEYRSDLFSLGVTLYYALCGVLPFGPRSKDDPPPTEEDLQPPPPHRFDDNIPLTLSRFTMVLLRQIDGVEYQDAGEALQALERDTEPLESWTGRSMDKSLDVSAAPVLAGYFERGILRRRSGQHKHLVDVLKEREATDRGQLHLVRGEPEIGKSRLVSEVATTMKLEGAEVLTVTCRPGMRAWELVQRLFARLVALGESRGMQEVEYYRPYLLILERISRLGSESTSQLSDAVDHDWIRQAFHDAIVTFHPDHIILFIEDLHQSDIASLQFLSEWYDYAYGDEADLEVPDVVATGVDSRSLDLFLSIEAIELYDLEGLTRTDAREFFAERLGLDECPETWVDQILEYADGRPAYLEELCRNLIAEGRLGRRSVSSWELEPGTFEAFELPEGLRASFRRRFSGAGASGREALELLTLYDRAVPWEAMCEHIAPSDAEDRESYVEASRQLESLRHRYLARMKLDAQGRYLQLLDDVLGDVVGDLMSDSWRRALHRRIGRHIRDAWRRGEAEPAEAGEHFEAGGAAEESIEMYETAGDRKWRAGEFGEAHDRYAAALEGVEEGPARAYLQIKQARVLLTLCEGADCRRMLEEAGGTAERTALDWLINNVFITATRLGLALGDSASAHRWLERLADYLPSMSQQMEVFELKGRIAFRHGDLEEASRVLERGLKRARHFGQRVGHARLLGVLGDVESWQGDPRRAETHFQEGLEIAETFGPTTARAELLCRYGATLRRRGVWDRAAEHLEESLEILSDGYRPDLWIEALLQLAMCKRRSGDRTEARRYVSDALTFAHELDDDVLLQRVRFALGDVDVEDPSRRESSLHKMETSLKALRRADTDAIQALELSVRYAEHVRRFQTRQAEPVLEDVLQRAETRGIDLGAAIASEIDWRAERRRAES